ncbi:hypothetical protein JOF29_004432 [Kribbella aluminosa]|uniref:PD-(D/E)XK endonuclease-like domain-containing protein n=1 Tax=Kribbella aluminosa TaxID=416017 RepID=A0ABS4UNU6_9ACTN|nr:hypothetical protein [Kribbella aluminosa]MBP2353322.1 hypothetical protein [Kribbella aluminosa]
MSALTDEVKDPASPVALWLRSTFPDHKEIQKSFRVAAGPQQLLMPATVAPGTQGAAIDWWLRMLADGAVTLRLPLGGLMKRPGPWGEAGLELLSELGGIRAKVDRPVVGPLTPGQFADRNDEWWARVCYALALMGELFRAPVENSRLMSLSESSRAADLLALANDAEVADLIAMRDLARQRLLPSLPAGPVASGMTFDGSKDLNADADLIAGGMLVDFKAGQGGQPRADGTRAASLARSDLDQLLGYTLLDYSDRFGLHTVAIYLARFGYLGAWPLNELCTQLAGRPIDLTHLRAEFAEVLRGPLRTHWNQRSR